MSSIFLRFKPFSSFQSDTLRNRDLDTCCGAALDKPIRAFLLVMIQKQPIFGAIFTLIPVKSQEHNEMLACREKN